MHLVPAPPDAARRQQMLREMGLQPLSLRATGVAVPASGAGRVLLLVARASAVAGAPGKRLLENIRAAFERPGTDVRVRVLEAAEGVPDADSGRHCLMFGAGNDGETRAHERMHELPDLQALLERPAAKREVWQVLRSLQRQGSAEED